MGEWLLPDTGPDMGLGRGRWDQGRGDLGGHMGVVIGGRSTGRHFTGNKVKNVSLGYGVADGG